MGWSQPCMLLSLQRAPSRDLESELTTAAPPGSITSPQPWASHFASFCYISLTGMQTSPLSTSNGIILRSKVNNGCENALGEIQKA